MPDVDLDKCRPPQLIAMQKAIRLGVAAGKEAERHGIEFALALSSDETGATIIITVPVEQDRA